MIATVHLLIGCALLSVIFCQENPTNQAVTTKAPDDEKNITLDLGPLCDKDTIEIEIKPYENCDSVKVSVDTCRGLCGSLDVTQPDAFLSSTECSCCSPSNYQMKGRKVLFQCGDTERERQVFLPQVNECGCVACAPDY